MSATTNTTTKTKPPKPKCPQCGRKKAIQRIGDDHCKCTGCGALFDTSSDEGGDYFTDPTKRMMRAEEDREQRSGQQRR